MSRHARSGAIASARRRNGNGGGGGNEVVTAHLPWNMFDDLSTVAAAPVAAHYFTQFPRRVGTNVPDYYQNYYLRPGAIETPVQPSPPDHRVYGGFTRDIPWIEEASPTTSGNWELYDMKVEVRQGIAAGLDGWTIDLLGLSNYHWDRTNRMCQAADDVNTEDGSNFWVVLMPDGTAGSTFGVRSGTVVDVDASADLLADKIHEIDFNRSCLYKPGGRLLLGIYGPEQVPSGYTKSTGGTFTTADRPAFWARVKSRLETTHSTPTDLWMCYVDTWTAAHCAPAFDSIAHGHGRWGDRDVDTTSSDTNTNRSAAQYCWDTYAKPWMHFGAPGDTRPREADWRGTQDYRTWESHGSRQFDASWKAAIGDISHRAADFQQVVTWNDLTEHAHISPSRNHKWVWCDLNTWYVTRYKKGAYPAIIRDGLYLFHRIHRSDVTINPSTLQTRFSVTAPGTAIKNEIEIRAFLTAPATIEVMADGVVIGTHSGLAGDNIFNTNLPSSNNVIISAHAKRSTVVVPGTLVTSEFPLESSPMADDYHYRGASSLRQV